MSGHNRTSSRSLDIPIELLPTLLHALIIARNTHMMSGHRMAQQRMEELTNQVEEMMPACLRAFDDVDVISIFDAAGKGPVHFAIHHNPWEWRPTRFRLLVISEDGRHWISEKAGPREEIETIARQTAQVLHEVADGFPGGSRNSQAEAEGALRKFEHEHGYGFVTRTSFLSYPDGETHLVHVFPPRTPRSERRIEDLPAAIEGGLVKLHPQSID